MDKIFIKPDAKEIVFRGKPEDGHVDAFSYNYEDNTANGLGGLFIVGQIQPVNEDTSYMINLVASLAKREYYFQPDVPPKEAFPKTLKKVNEVLNDFFHNKDTKANIGIFAIAGENIFISRLGKFKIILARENESIDILNNINLFSKEHIQEKEFSNIISGKIKPQDKILAYYPGKSIAAREKIIKADFLNLGAEDFAEKLKGIKEKNENFLCACIHLTINKRSEPAIIVPLQPQEWESDAPRAVLAKTARTQKEKSSAVSPELPNIRPSDKFQPSSIATPETPEPSPIKTGLASQPEKNPLADEKSNVYYPGSRNLSAIDPEQSKKPVEPETLIRPSEFSSAKKENIFDMIFRKFKPGGIYVLGRGRNQIFSKKRLAIGGSLLAVIVVAVIAKYTFAPSLPIPVPGALSPEEKATDELVSQAEAGLESAKAKIGENNLLEARKILRTYFEALEAQTQKTQRLNKVENDILATLDQVDKAVPFSPNLLQEAPQNLEDAFQVWSFVWSLAKGEFKLQKPDITGMMGFYPYQDNLYILASDGIYKITDALKGKSSTIAWLNKDVFLPHNPVSLATDSKIYIISEDGILATYYKGDKTAEVNTSIPASKTSALLTVSSSNFLYLLDKGFGRIYVIAKDTGALIKTLKLGNEKPIVDASMADDGSIYLLSSDNKVWKVVP